MKQDKWYNSKQMESHKFFRDYIAKKGEKLTDDKQKAIDIFDKRIEEEEQKPRAKFHITVDAQIDNCTAEMLLWHQSTTDCPLSEHTTLYDILHKQFPAFDWQQDDGDDSDEAENTDYCQYVYYPNPDDKSDCVLAVYWVEEETDNEGAQ